VTGLRSLLFLVGIGFGAAAATLVLAAWLTVRRRTTS
jgi:hypothetical protein